MHSGTLVETRLLQVWHPMPTTTERSPSAWMTHCPPTSSPIVNVQTVQRKLGTCRLISSTAVLQLNIV